jgi:hypothetical protein
MRAWSRIDQHGLAPDDTQPSDVTLPSLLQSGAKQN